MNKTAGANQPVTWGALYLMYLELGRFDLANWCLDHILKLDSVSYSISGISPHS